MPYFWVKFTGRGPMCVTATDKDDAKAKVEAAGGIASEIFTLPYPATPRFNLDTVPEFCISPEECKGRTACPRRYSCTE